MRPRTPTAATTGRPSPIPSGWWRRSLPPILAAIGLVAIAGSAVPRPAAAQARVPNVAIIVHPQTPVDTLTFGEMRKVFRGERQYWTSNVPIVLLMRAPVAIEREVILKRVYEMSEAQFKQFWIAKIFRDEAAVVPKILYSNDQISDLVSAIPGSLGFVDAAAVRPGLKVLKIDGRLPGQPGYPLQ
jgi:ABC-type phosphate transport system substrate-binding protein